MPCAGSRAPPQPRSSGRTRAPGRLRWEQAQRHTSAFIPILPSRVPRTSWPHSPSAGVISASGGWCCSPGAESPARLLERLWLRQVLATARGALSPLEYAALMGVSRGESYEELAARLGRRPKQIDNAVQRARGKLRALFPEAG